MGIRGSSERKLVRKHGIGGNSSVEDDAEAARRRLGLLVVALSLLISGRDGRAAKPPRPSPDSCLTLSQQRSHTPLACVGNDSGVRSDRIEEAMAYVCVGRRT